MKTLENKSLEPLTVIVDGQTIVRVKPLSSLKKMSMRPRKSLSRVKSLRPLKAAGKGPQTESIELD